MIKGFIEVHNYNNEDKLVLINVRHITDVWGSEIYLGKDDYIKCAETYEEIKQKIKEAVGDADER